MSVDNMNPTSESKRDLDSEHGEFVPEPSEDSSEDAGSTAPSGESSVFAWALKSADKISSDLFYAHKKMSAVFSAGDTMAVLQSPIELMILEQQPSYDDALYPVAVKCTVKRRLWPQMELAILPGCAGAEDGR